MPVFDISGINCNNCYNCVNSFRENFSLARVTEGKDPVHEKMLRPIAAEVDWETQREMWNDLPSSN